MNDTIEAQGIIIRNLNKKISEHEAKIIRIGSSLNEAAALIIGCVKKYGKNNELRLNEECMKINPYDMRLNTTFDEIAKELVIKVEDIKR